VDWQERLVADPAIYHGNPCINGTRILVTVILDNLAEGLDPDAIAAEYPPLTRADIHSANAYATDLAREQDLLPLRSAR